MSRPFSRQPTNPYETLPDTGRSFFAHWLPSLWSCRGWGRHGQGGDSPNIILILSDDQGFNDYGFMGHQVARTPNLDRMAAQSLLYTRGYVMPVCSPSLACLLTGKLPHAHGITGNDLGKSAATSAQAAGMKGRSPLSHQLLGNSVILPKALSEAGYLTFQTGKLWNVTAAEVGFTSGMTNTEGRHGGAGLDIGRKTMQPVFDFIADAQSRKSPFCVVCADDAAPAPQSSEGVSLALPGKGTESESRKLFCHGRVV
ncbi:MAG: sulfatase-like hydrolase/transferase [Verrucomicrobiales bacterium]